MKPKTIKAVLRHDSGYKRTVILPHASRFVETYGKRTYRFELSDYQDGLVIYDEIVNLTNINK